MDQYGHSDVEFTGPPSFDVWFKGQQLASGARRISPETIAIRILIAGFGIFALTQMHGVFLTVAVAILVVGLPDRETGSG